MAPHLDRVTDLDILFLDASQKDALRVGGFERPRLAFHVEVDDRVGDDEDDLLDRAFHHGPCGEVVVAVRVMSGEQDAQARYTQEGRAESSEMHVTPPLSHFGGRTTVPSMDVFRSRTVNGGGSCGNFHSPYPSV